MAPTIRNATDFTVVVPAYNAREFLRDALASVRAQSMAPASVVVVDDGSTDGTGDAARTWLDELRLPGVVLRQANGGISSARNAGLDAATTAWVALLDADDVWMPGHLESLSRAAAAFPEAVAVASDSVYFGPGEGPQASIARAKAMALVEASLPGGVHRLSRELFGALIPGLFLSPSAAAFRTDLVAPSLRFNTALRTSEDREFFLRLARLGPFAYVDQVTCSVRRHACNTTRAENAAMVQENALGSLEIMARQLTALELSPREVTALRGALLSTSGTMLYRSSTCGLVPYLAACRRVGPHVPWFDRYASRHMLRALLRSF